jgi:DNA-binding transcriptional LysR family regulator
VSLTGEEVFPVCSPELLRDRTRPLKKPADLARQVLLHYDDPAGQFPWLSWRQWLDAFNLAELKPIGVAHYSHYDQMVQAAIAGEGVALGRTPLIRRLLKSGVLVAPFKDRMAGTREYFVIVAPHAAARAPVAQFVQWLQQEIRREP